MRYQNTARYCLFLLAWLQLPVSSLASSLPLSWNDTVRIANQVNKGLWLMDISGKMTAEEAFSADAALFQPFSKLHQPFPGGAVVWGRFMLEPVPPKDASLRYLYISDYTFDRFSLFFQDQEAIHARHAGILVPHNQLPFQDNFMAIPLRGSEAVQPTVLLRVENEKLSSSRLEGLYLLTPRQEEDMRRAYHDSRRANHLYYFVFFGILGALFFFFLLQWAIHREQAALYYFLYLASLGLFYWRSFESYQYYLRPFFKHLAALHHSFEPLFSLASYIFYMKFVEAFLDLPEWNPRLSRIMRACTGVFLAAAPVLFAIQAIWGAAVMLDVFTYFRFSFFGLAFLVIWSIWTKSRRPLAIFIFTGSLFLIIGGVMTFLDDIFGGTIIKNASGTLGWYYSPNGWAIPIFDFKIGIMLEVGLFSIGLGYKQQMLQKEHRQLFEHLQWAEKLMQAYQNGAAPAAVPKYPFLVETPFVRQAVAQIEAHLAEEGFGVQELARAMAMSRGQLFRRIKDDLGMSPIKLIHAVRLWEARRLLESEGLSVSETAYSVGFGSPSYFTKLYKGAFGYVPSERGGAGLTHHDF